MSTPTLTYKLLLFRRCIKATLLSVASQFILLTIFQFADFQWLHPLNWVANTLRLVCSFYTWFGSIPLVAIIMIYCVTLSQQYFAERNYCATRYRWLLHNGPRKLLLMGTHLLVGFSTAWLYTGYMHTDYRNLFYMCYGKQCLSSYCVFLLGMGTVAGLYYFVVVHMRHEVSIDFDIMELSRGEKLYKAICTTLSKMPMRAVLLALSYTFVFWLCGSVLKHNLCQLFRVDADEHLVSFLDFVTNVRLLFYAWLLTAQILTNMELMRRFFSMLLAEDLPLVVMRDRLVIAQERQVTIVSALSVFNVYVVQCLAAQFLFKLAHRQNSSMRLQVFALTEPGNHPANWRALCDLCLSIINGFTDELSDSLRNISTMKGVRTFSPPPNDTNAKLMAEKLLLRQYNKLHGIRPIVSPLRELSAEELQARQVDRIRHVRSWCERVSVQLEAALQRLLQRIPGLVYFFSEPEGAKTTFLLSTSLPLLWLTQALAQLCVASLTEDNFGVVQKDLSSVVRALHRLKCELDKLGNVLANTRTINQNYNLMRAAVRRSLYNYVGSFNDYLGELVSAEELRQLQNFIRQD